MSDNETFVTELLSAQIASLNTENGALKAAVERVRALHVRVQGKHFPAFCEHCDSKSYPCDTIRALEGTP